MFATWTLNQAHRADGLIHPESRVIRFDAAGGDSPQGRARQTKDVARGVPRERAAATGGGVDWGTWDENRLADTLFRVSGRRGPPRQDDYLMVAACLHHARSEIRERAILIGGMRWADPTLLGYFQGALATGSEADDENRRLMVECLVSDCMHRQASIEPLLALLHWVLLAQPRGSIAAKATFMGIERLSGRLDASDYARIDYACLELPDLA